MSVRIFNLVVKYEEAIISKPMVFSCYLVSIDSRSIKTEIVGRGLKESVWLCANIELVLIA
jgi:hypothetical protein